MCAEASDRTQLNDELYKNIFFNNNFSSCLKTALEENRESRKAFHSLLDNFSLLYLALHFISANKIILT